ncbi:MAG: class I SAM-dependent methyltransferase [Treponema sp.]|nr:class I SAM-dependent methyltransferase [Treponema sp.]
MDKNEAMYINPQYSQDLFKGTSAYYSQYRPPYNKDMISEIMSIVNAGQNDTLLDLACGPGRLTIPLSKFFKDVYAVDWENEMVKEGERISRELKIENIKWMYGKAEDVNFESDILKLITIGDAFHRMDQLKILQNSYRMLKKEGYLALIYSNPVTKGDSEWQKELEKVLSSWRKESIQNNENSMQPWNTFLEETGYKNISSQIYEQKMTLKIDEIMGYLYSMSIYSKNAIGDEYRSFENTIRQKLLKIKPENKFEYVFTCGYHIGMK